VLSPKGEDDHHEGSGTGAQPTRRKVLTRLWGLTGWSLVAGSGVLLHRTLSAARPPSRTVTLAPTVLDQARADGGLVTDELFLRVVEGEPRALRLRCTHLGCAVTFDRQAGLLRCPCHGSHFDLNGAPTSGPAAEPLEQVTLHRNGDRWEAQLDEPSGAL